MFCSTFRFRWFAGSTAVPAFLLMIAGFASSAHAQSDPVVLAPSKQRGSWRIATFNVSLNRNEPGRLQYDLECRAIQIQRVAAIIRAVQPDVLLLNEIDYDPTAHNAETFQREYLANASIDLLGSGPWPMPYVYDAPVNTGVPSGLDLNGDGEVGGPEDAWGFGRFPGQYGMAILSRFPIDVDAARTFQSVRWSAMPQALQPRNPETGEPFYASHVWEQLRLPSKSFWDVPLSTPDGVLHVLASHPTPPAFDGPEDRNGCRNHDEIRLIVEYVEGAEWIRDDRGRPGSLPQSAAFAVLGDLNSDPNDGGSRSAAIRALLAHRRIARFPAPRSDGAASASQEQNGVNASHRGDPQEDTADFNDRTAGNLRVDYVLPSRDCQVVQSGVVWPDLRNLPAAQRDLVRRALAASDHHLVWVDVRLPDRHGEKQP